METETFSKQLPINADWYSDEFIHDSVVTFLKKNGYKIHKENNGKENEKDDKKIIATKFFKKEIIEIRGFPHYNLPHVQTSVPKSVHAKNSFSEALFNSFINFTLIENAEVALAVPNISRYQGIIEKLHDYFTFNDLHFRIYLVNEDGSVEVSNLNEKHAKSS